MAGSILVTGGRGGLGRPLVERLRAAGHDVRVMSRGPAGDVRADLASGAGLEAAVAGCSVVVHAASDAAGDVQATDVDGTGRLLAAARKAGVEHLVYVSIVGVDRAKGLDYYRAKREAEWLVERGGLPWTILRATQFLDLLPIRILPRMRRLGVVVVGRGWLIQPVAVEEVAGHLAEVAIAPPAGLLPPFGGPEVLTWARIASDWAAAGGMPGRVLALPLPGAMGRSWRSGVMTCPDHRDGRLTWAEWLASAAPRS